MSMNIADAAAAGDVDTLKTLIEPPYCTSPDAVNHFVNNACTTAASERRKGIFHEGLLPMNIAAKEGKTKALKLLSKLLIANGGKVNMVHADGATAVIVASGWGQTAALKVLLENGGDVHLALDNGCTAVYIASQGDNPEALKLLIKYKADVNKAAGVGRRRVAATVNRGVRRMTSGRPTVHSLKTTYASWMTCRRHATPHWRRCVVAVSSCV